MEKSVQRAALIFARKERLRARSAPTDQQLNDKVVAAVLSNSHIAKACEQARVIASYQSFGTEPPTGELNRVLLRAGASLIVPHYQNPDGTRRDELSWHRLTASGVEEAPIAESLEAFHPLACAAMLIPALAVGKDGSRLGRGGGYYDKCLTHLPRFPKGPRRIALVYDDEVFDSLDSEAHDESVDEWLAITST